MTYKHTVITDDYTDIMIHPKQVFGDLKELWKNYLAKTAPSDWISLKRCTACEGEEIGPFFSIWGYRYDRCRKCASVFLNPQPEKSVYEKAFYDSPISEFLKSDKVQKQYEARFEKTIHPLLSEIIHDSKSSELRILEVFGRNRHIIDYLNGQQKVKEYLRFESGMEDGAGRSISVENLKEVNDSSCDLILLLMSIEQMREPAKMLSKLSKKLSKEGRMIILARLGSGIDVQLLRGNNSSIFPLEHIHLFSIEGYEYICERVGLEIYELSTPGLLDTEYLKQYYKMHPEENDIFQYLFRHRSSLDIRRFQQFIQEVRLSSALRLICKRKAKQQETG